MHNTLTTLTFIIGILFLLSIVGGVSVVMVPQVRFNKGYVVDPPSLPIPSEPDHVDRGEVLNEFYCTGCHGNDLAGRLIDRSMLGGVYVTPDLTSGEGGMAMEYSEEALIVFETSGIGEE